MIARERSREILELVDEMMCRVNDRTLFCTMLKCCARNYLSCVTLCCLQISYTLSSWSTVKHLNIQKQQRSKDWFIVWKKCLCCTTAKSFHLYQLFSRVARVNRHAWLHSLFGIYNVLQYSFERLCAISCASQSQSQREHTGEKTRSFFANLLAGID